MRESFRKEVFKRDDHKCIICGDTAQDAHHILERRLFPDGGYVPDNGASLCGFCHLKAEMTLISVEEIRHQAGITKKIIPPHLYHDQEYDKWGNPILSNGQRVKGELFHDESVQKILSQGKVLNLFTDYVKYPRTHHLPWSQGITKDDRILEDLSYFKDKRVIVTEKLDGENTTMYSDHIHARSVDSGSHSSQTWVRNFWAQIAHDIPPGWRVCGENMYAKHSIEYSSLSTFFYGFSIWDERNNCLSWDESLEWFKLLGITPVPVLYDGTFDEKQIKKLYDSSTEWETREGYVLRTAYSYPYIDFRKSVGKYVRKNHVQTSKHWFYGQKIETNTLK